MQLRGEQGVPTKHELARHKRILTWEHFWTGSELAGIPGHWENYVWNTEAPTPHRTKEMASVLRPKICGITKGILIIEALVSLKAAFKSKNKLLRKGLGRRDWSLSFTRKWESYPNQVQERCNAWHLQRGEEEGWAGSDLPVPASSTDAGSRTVPGSDHPWDDVKTVWRDGKAACSGCHLEAKSVSALLAGLKYHSHRER